MHEVWLGAEGVLPCMDGRSYIMPVTERYVLPPHPLFILNIKKNDEKKDRKCGCKIADHIYEIIINEVCLSE